jgi:very-short-patch-repair endonuclease
MATMKMKVARNPTDLRRRVASTGAFGVPGSGGRTAFRYAKSSRADTPITKNAFAGSGVAMAQPMFFSPMHTPQNWQIASKRREVYQWARFYYENEPKVAAGVDFYANFPMNGFKLECPDSEILEHFEQVVEDLDLDDWLNYISHEYFLMGDVFPFLEIQCEQCLGSGKDPETGEVCTHPGGTFSSIRVMNPDYIEVQDNVLAKEPVIALLPDEELKMIIQRRQPKQIYDNLPSWLVELIAAGQPIPLSPRSISHLRYNGSAYGTYGTTMIRRLFTILAYKTKLMTANWIVAERLILPIRVVKVGDEKRPASEEDLADVQTQLMTVANDPNLTLVTHHAFEYEWYGANGKIVQLNNEMEAIGKEILDGLMLNQSLLNGEMTGYNSAQVGVETMIRRLENWRKKLKNWVEKHIFLPISQMQGYVDEKKSKRTDRTAWIYPTIKWNELNLRDNTSRVQLMLQVYDKGGVAMQTICEELGLDYDGETEKLRQEQMIASASGMLQQGGQEDGGMGGAPPGDMGGGGGAPPMGDPSGAAPAGDMGAAAGPGMMPVGGPDPSMAAAASAPAKLMKGGKNKKDSEEMQPPPSKMLKLTKLEATVYNELMKINPPYKLFGQYQIHMPGQKQPYVLDFAYPELGVGIEADGAIWHERNDLKERDRQRDEKLSNVGWRILRFSENAIYEHADAVRDVIHKQIAEAAKDIKKAAEIDRGEGLIKLASLKASALRQKPAQSLEIELEDFEQEDLGYIVRIGI